MLMTSANGSKRWGRPMTAENQAARSCGTPASSVGMPVNRRSHLPRMHGMCYGRLRPFCSRQRMFSTSAFTFAFSALEFSMVYGSGCWAANTEPSSNSRR
jgi:hypothetical protein